MGSCLSGELFVKCMDCNDGVYTDTADTRGVMMVAFPGNYTRTSPCRKCEKGIMQHYGFECNNMECKKKVCQQCYQELRKDKTNLTKDGPKETKLTKEEEEMFDQFDKVAAEAMAQKKKY
eukprot:116674_1